LHELGELCAVLARLLAQAVLISVL